VKSPYLRCIRQPKHGSSRTAEKKINPAMHVLWWWVMLLVQQEFLLCCVMGLCISRQRSPVTPKNSLSQSSASPIEDSSPESSLIQQPQSRRRRQQQASRKRRLRGHHRAMSDSSIAQSREFEKASRSKQRKGDSTPPALFFRPRGSDLRAIPSFELAERTYLDMLRRVEMSIEQQQDEMGFVSPTSTVTRPSELFDP
jgi:hypothetical protein